MLAVPERAVEAIQPVRAREMESSQPGGNARGANGRGGEGSQRRRTFAGGGEFGERAPGPCLGMFVAMSVRRAVGGASFQALAAVLADLLSHADKKVREKAARLLYCAAAASDHGGALWQALERSGHTAAIVAVLATAAGTKMKSRATAPACA